MKLIAVTCFENGKKAYINPSKVCAVYPHFKNPENTIVDLGVPEEYLSVLESVDTVAQMIEMAEMNEERFPPEQPEQISEEYAREVWTWLIEYQIRYAKLQDEYTPYEVLSWVVNDWGKENGMW